MGGSCPLKYRSKILYFTAPFASEIPLENPLFCCSRLYISNNVHFFKITLPIM